MLIAIKGLGIGGAERLISEGANHWRRDLFDYQVAYALPWKDQLVTDLEELDVPVHMVGDRRGLTLRSLPRLRDLIGSLGTRVVHAHLPAMGVATRLTSPVPVIYTEHNMVSSYHPVTRWANRITYRKNAAVVAVSNEVAQSLEGYPGPTPLVIPNGVACRVSTEEAMLARKELGIESDRPLIVQVGNIRPHKGHLTLIEAIATIGQRRGDLQVVSVGAEKHPGDLERMRRYAASRGVADRIRFLGRREDALRFVAAGDVFVNPSTFEGLPLVVLEAMALGTPVVATAVGGVPSVVRPDETGVLVDPDDPQALAEAILFTLDHPAQTEGFARAARRLVASTYSLERMVGAYEDVYRSVLHG
ncbi:MAG TPA: glycosyltransferase [Acidimicrobiia bacterium]